MNEWTTGKEWRVYSKGFCFSWWKGFCYFSYTENPVIFFFFLIQYYVQKKQQKSFDGTWTDLKKSDIVLLMEKTFVNWGRVTGHFFFTKPRLNVTELLDWLDGILSSFLALKDNGNFLLVQKHFWLKSLRNIFLYWKSIEKGKFNRKL